MQRSIVGDMVWYVVLEKLTIHISDTMTSVFDDGNNLRNYTRGIKELQVTGSSALAGLLGSGFARQLNTLRRILADMHLDKPQSYSFYRSGKQRKLLKLLNQPTFGKDERFTDADDEKFRSMIRFLQLDSSSTLGWTGGDDSEVAGCQSSGC